MSEPIDDRRRCERPECNRLIPKNKQWNMQVKYCGSGCRNKVNQQRVKAKRLKAKMEALTREEMVEITTGRRGPTFDRIRQLLSDEEWDDWLNGRLLNATISRQLGVAESAVYRSKVTALADRRREGLSDVWELGEDQVQMLGPTDEAMHALYEEGLVDEFEAALDEAISGFKLFRDTYFFYRTNTPFITHQFHLDWMRETLRSIYTGGRTMILSPPRHGKSELLVHFCVWLIIRNPNIRILWVGPSDDIAENMLGSVRDVLEENEELARDFLPPNQQWHNKGKWGASKFTVGNRTIQHKQPTMWRAGARGRILSLDCDFIVVDDPEDPDEAQSPTTREKTKNWFRVKLGTRKMFHTGLVMIGSRVHVDDLFSAYVDSNVWNVIVDKAHDTSICGADLYAEDGHDGCVLFPELNPIEYLREQEELVTRPLFEMIYLNQPRPESQMIFNPDLIREQCLDRSRVIGVNAMPEGTYKLVAGLDPAARATQAAFLWAYGNDGNAYMVDLETQQAGGMEGAISVMHRWRELYGCDLWVVEDVGYQKTFFDHPGVRALKAQGMTVRPTHTGKNKHDAHFGVSAMAVRYHTGRMTLPYGDTASRKKVDMLIKELTMFTDDVTAQRRRKSDILMASWFPWSEVIKRWESENRAKSVDTSYAPSYPSITGFGTHGTSPWATKYPGR